jgi:transient receptor potential cation channel subfamily V protein 5
MGNTASDVTNNVKAQADAAESATYKLVNMKGGGELISLMETAKLTKDYTSVNEQIKQKVSGLLYNEGKGEYVTAPNRNKLLLKEPLWIDSSF